MSDDALVVGWASGPIERTAAARVLTAAMTAGTDYISHSEIQQGLSRDGMTWSAAPDKVFEGYAAWLREHDEVEVAQALDGEAIAGVAVVRWSLDGPAPFATLEDMAVVAARRGTGAGRRLLAFVEAAVAQRGGRWLFLESGIRNRRAHAFFAANGFNCVSHSFAKPIEDPIS